MVSFAAELAGDVAKMARIKNLGTLLNEVYPDGSRAPDDFSHDFFSLPRQNSDANSINPSSI